MKAGATSINRGCRDDRLQVIENGIEPLHVADLEHAAVLPGQLDQFPRLRGVVGHRLLDEHMLALLQEDRASS